MATAAQSRPQGPARPRLTRAEVLAAALAVIDREGVEGLTMRKLGAEAGVEAMSLYHYVADKADVLDGVVALLWERIEAALPTDGSWQQRVWGLATAVREVAHAHPQAYPLMLTRGTLPPQGLEVAGRLLAWLREAGFGPLAGEALSAVAGHVVSAVLAELTWNVDHSPQAGCTATEAAIPAGRDELSDQARQVLGECDDDACFAFGMDLIVAGLEAKLTDQAVTNGG